MSLSQCLIFVFCFFYHASFSPNSAFFQFLSLFPWFSDIHVVTPSLTVTVTLIISHVMSLSHRHTDLFPAAITHTLVFSFIFSPLTVRFYLLSTVLSPPKVVFSILLLHSTLLYSSPVVCRICCHMPVVCAVFSCCCLHPFVPVVFTSHDHLASSLGSLLHLLFVLLPSVLILSRPCFSVCVFLFPVCSQIIIFCYLNIVVSY